MKLHTVAASRTTPTVLLILIALIGTGWHTLWSAHHGANTPRDDDANLFHLAVWTEQVLDGQLKLADGMPAMTPYPPLIPTLAALSFGDGPRSLSLAVGSLWPFVFLLSLFTGLGVRRAQGTAAGLAAAALTPVITAYWQIRGQFYAEVPLAACIVTAVVALEASGQFRRLGWCLVLGLSLAAGLLTKWTFAFFLGPVMALAATIGVAQLARPRLFQGALALLTLSTLVGVGAAAMGRCPPPVPAGLGVGLGLTLAGLVFRKEYTEDAGRRLTGLLIAGGVCAVLAAPWYLWQLDTLRAFLASNTSQQYQGDLPSLSEGWLYYPAVLLTRFLDTPQSILLLLGVLGSLVPGRSRLGMLCLLTLVCGLTALGVAPYRNHRYLVAALGLLTPVMFGALGGGRLVRWVSPFILAYALHRQQSWVVAIAGNGDLLWELSTPPPRDLFGNHRKDVAQARRELLRPTWQLHLVSPPPIHEVSAAREIAGIVARDAGRDPAGVTGAPWELRFSDPQGLLTCDAVSAELAARRSPPGSSCQPLQGGQRGVGPRYVVEVSPTGNPGWEPAYRQRASSWLGWRHKRLGAVRVRGFAPGMEGLATVWRAP